MIWDIWLQLFGNPPNSTRWGRWLIVRSRPAPDIARHTFGRNVLLFSSRMHYNPLVSRPRLKPLEPYTGGSLPPASATFIT
jgi:hypothetical protein